MSTVNIMTIITTTDHASDPHPESVLLVVRDEPVTLPPEV